MNALTLSRTALVRLFALAVLLGTLALAPPAHAQSASAARQQAQTALDAGRFGEALNVLNAALDRNTNDPDLLLLRARAYEKRGQNGQAATDYQSVLAVRPSNADAIAGLNRVQSVQGGSNGSALDIARRQAEASPSNLGYRLKYAEALLDARRYDDAVVQYETYLDQTQGTPDIAIRYLIALAATSQHPKGEREARKYLQVYPGSDDLYMRLGYFLYWQGKYDGAQSAFEQAIALNGSNKEAREGLAKTLNRPAGSDFPIDRLAADLKRNPDQVGKRYELAQMYVQAGRYLEAKQTLDYFKRAEQGSTKFDGLYAQALRGYNNAAPLAGKKGPDRIAQLQRKVKRSPNNESARFDLIEALIGRKRYAEAFEQLDVLADDHLMDRRWISAFEKVDDRLDDKETYLLARLDYRMRLSPNSMEARYAVVDELQRMGRYAEAYRVLLDGANYATGDPMYQRRVERLKTEQVRYAQGQIQVLSDRISADPNDAQAMKDLAYNYGILQSAGYDVDVTRALRLYERLLSQDPYNQEVRYQYAQLLVQAGQTDQALAESQRLYQADSTDPRFVAQYVYAAEAAGFDTEGAQRALENALRLYPNDTTLLLAGSTFYTTLGDLDRAEQFLSTAEFAGADLTDIAARRAFIAQVRNEAVNQANYAYLEKARRFLGNKQYPMAIRAYDEYFEIAGTRTRAEVIEYADAYAASGDYATAVSILETLQAEQYTDQVALRVARYQFDGGDFDGALFAVDQAILNDPNNFEARLLKGDALRELERYDEARVVYDDATYIAPASPLLAERYDLLDEASSRNGYTAVLVPNTEFISAAGSGIGYRRFAPGVQAQLTVPLEFPAVFFVGVRTHDVRGNRTTNPSSQEIEYRINEIGGGVNFDLTAPIRGERFGEEYTNRITARLGLLSYTDNEFIGDRSEPFYSVRYWHQTPGLFRASVGARQTEAVLDLWAAGAPTANIQSRLTQLDARGEAYFLPDSLVKVNGTIAYNLISDNLTPDDTDNQGISVQLKAGYQIINNVYIGGQYFRLQYDNNAPYYFSPAGQAFELYEAFAEYEYGGDDGLYFRALGALGTVANSGGFLTRRVEADLVYPVMDNLGLGVNLRASDSQRDLDGADVFQTADSYGIFIINAALYLTF